VVDRHRAVRRAERPLLGPAGPPAPTGDGGRQPGGHLLLGKTFTVAAGTVSGSVSLRVDNDVAVYLNGSPAGSAIHDG
jgi:hypothetical protein